MDGLGKQGYCLSFVQLYYTGKGQKTKKQIKKTLPI